MEALVRRRRVRLLRLLLLLAADRLHVVAARQQQVGAARHGRSGRRVRVRDGWSRSDRSVLRSVLRRGRVLRSRGVRRLRGTVRRRVRGARTDGDNGREDEDDGGLHGFEVGVRCANDC